MAENKKVKKIKRNLRSASKKLDKFERGGDTSRATGSLAVGSLAGSIGVGIAGVNDATSSLKKSNFKNFKANIKNAEFMAKESFKGPTNKSRQTFDRLREPFKKISKLKAGKLAIKAGAKNTAVAAALFVASVGLGKLTKKLRAKRDTKKLSIINKEINNVKILREKILKSPTLSKADNVKVRQALQKFQRNPDVEESLYNKFDKNNKLVGVTSKRGGFPELSSNALSGKTAIKASKTGVKGRWVTIGGRRIFMKGATRKKA